MGLQVVMRLVVVAAFYRGVFDGPIHALHLSIRPELIDAGQFIGNPAGFGAWLAGRLPQTATAGTGSEFVCAPDSCQLPEKRA